MPHIEPVLDEKTMWMIARKIAPHWMPVGRTLGLKSSHLDNIKRNYSHSYSLEELTCRMLQKWKQIYPRECRPSILIYALKKENLHDIAEELQREFNVDVPQHSLIALEINKTTVTENASSNNDKLVVIAAQESQLKVLVTSNRISEVFLDISTNHH